jgi:hypothetical protein
VRRVADLYELVLAMDLGAGLTGDELAELRWHVGQGPRPERLPIGTGDHLEAYPLDDPGDPDCRWETADPEPVFAERGAAARVGGALVAELVAREPDGWALTVRQELHPDSFYALRALLEWLGPRADGLDGVERFVGYLRFHEDAGIVPLVLAGGRVRLPEAVEAHTPHWRGA